MFAFVLAALALFCVAAPACANHRASPGDATREETRRGVRFLEIFAGGADDTSPLVIGIHGRGGSPERFAALWTHSPMKAEFAMPEAPTRFGPGFSWFDPWRTDDEAADHIGAAEEKLWPAIAEVAHGRKVIVTGFSQGGYLSYALAARHPDEVAYALPISGGLPPRLWPKGGARTAPIHGLHGVDDRVVDVAYARATIGAFRNNGSIAELREFPGVGHAISQPMRADLWDRVRDLCEPRGSSRAGADRR